MQDFVNKIKNRTFLFSADTINFCELIYAYTPSKFICDQLARSSGSIGSNYRAACRPKSNKDFFNKLNIVLEEAGESLFRLIDYTMPNVDKLKLNKLMKEVNELISIFVKSIVTSKTSINKSKTLITKKNPNSNN
jgi:four helix bundle protein